MVAKQTKVNIFIKKIQLENVDLSAFFFISNGFSELEIGGFGLSTASLLLIVVGIWSGVYCLKITSKIRNYNLSIMATPKEVLEYLDTYDEGEKQAEMEEAYLILFKVNQLLIPGIYVVLVVLSVVLGQVQLVALLVAVVIHLYTNVAQLRKTKRYFK